MVSHAPMPDSKSHSQKSALKWIGGYLMQEKAVFMPSVAALLFTAVLSLAFPFYLGKLIGSPADAFKQDLDAQVVLEQSNQIVLTLICVLAVQAIVAFFRVQGFIRSGESALNRLRRDLFAHLIVLPMSYFQEQRSGSLSNRVSADLGVVRDTLLNTVPQMARQGVILIGGLIAVFFFSWKLSLIMLGSVPVVVLAIAFFGRKVRGYSRCAQDALADAGTVIEETVQGVADVKAFTNEDFEEKRYLRALDNFLAVTKKGAINRAAFLAFVIFALFGTISFVVWKGSRMLAAGEITQENFISFILFSIFVGASLGSLPEIVSQLHQTSGAVERLNELLDLEPERVGGEKEVELSGSLEFRNVSFSYSSRPDIQVLKNLSFVVEPGQRVALVGPSGAGKSTTFAMVLGFNEPDQGAILFDGREASELALEALRSQIAIVPQEVLLFGGSIRENIEYGRPGASSAEIQEAAKQANAHEFISELPEAYDTLVGPRGTKLSGGQRQRIAIARALLADPRILLLDEATSALDSESERLVNEALEKLMKGRTSLVIAHRLSTVRHAERILCFNQGRLAESGTHDELIERGGTYKYLVETQLV